MPSTRRLFPLESDLILLTLLAVFAWAPLTHPGFPQTHAGLLPVFNLHDLGRRWGDLAWGPAVGRVHDLWRGEGPFPYYLAAALRALGLDGGDAIKAVGGLAVVVGAWGLYAWARPWLGRGGALLSAVVYAYWPYALAARLVRGAWAEAVWMGLWPLALWALEAAKATGQKRNLATLAFAAALLAWTQAGLAAWAWAALWARLLSWREARARGRVGAALLAGALLGAAGLAPQAVNAGWGGPAPVDFIQHLVYPFQFFLAGWGDGLSVAGWQDMLPLSLGLAAVGLTVVAWVVGPPTAGRDLFLFAVGASVVGLFLASTLAAPLWSTWPTPARTLTYPWQLLGLVGPFLALLAGAAFPALAGRDQRGEEAALRRSALHAGLVAMVVLASYAYLQPRYITLTPPRAPTAILGDHQVMLVDVEVEGALRAGEKIGLTARWQALKPLDKDYSIFVHVVDEKGERWGQHDTQPQGGRYPMTRWRVGEVVEDRYEVLIRADGPADGYRVILGLYDWQTGARLRVGDADHVVITRG